MLTEMSKNWWLYLLRGLAAIAFGILVFIWPTQGWSAMVILFGIFALLDGIVTLVTGIEFHKYFDGWWTLVLEGVVGIVIGGLTLVWLGTAGQVLYYLVAAWMALTGICELVTAIRFRSYIPGEWSMALAGILAIVCGVLMIVFPGAGLVALVWVIGIFAIFYGVMQLVFSNELHDLGSDIKQHGLSGI